ADTELHLEVTDRHTADTRRSNDRPTTFVINLKLTATYHDRSNVHCVAAGNSVETRIEATIRPRRDRDRRRDAVVDKARRLLGSLKSYLMAQEDDGKAPPAEAPQVVAAAQS